MYRQLPLTETLFSFLSWWVSTWQKGQIYISGKLQIAYLTKWQLPASLCRKSLASSKHEIRFFNATRENQIEATYIQVHCTAFVLSPRSSPGTQSWTQRKRLWGQHIRILLPQLTTPYWIPAAGTKWRLKPHSYHVLGTFWLVENLKQLNKPIKFICSWRSFLPRYLRRLADGFLSFALRLTCLHSVCRRWHSELEGCLR